MLKKKKRIGKLILIFIILLVVVISAFIYIWKTGGFDKNKATEIPENTENIMQQAPPTKVIEQMGEQLAELYPPDFDKEKIRDQWAKFVEAIREERIDEDYLKEFLQYLQTAIKDKKVTNEEGEKILDLLKKTVKK